jgi:hypothetical protein
MKNQRSIKLAIRRSLRHRALGGKHYDKARAAVVRARDLGLRPGQPIELEVTDEKTGAIETRKFILVDNFDAEVAYKTASVQRYDIKPLPKNPRGPKIVDPATKPDPTEETAQ